MDAEMGLEMEKGPFPVDKEYPGINFTPPDDALPSDAMEGEALVKWKKVGDAYTIVEFEGKPVSSDKIPMTPEGLLTKKEEHKLKQAFKEIDAIYTV